MAAVGALLAGSLSIAAPAQAGPNINVATATAAASVAAAKTKAPAPKIVLGKQKITKTGAPKRSKQWVRLPVLKNSTLKNRTLFTKYATEAVKAERKTFDKFRKSYCSSNQTATFSANPTYRNVYKGRYASVTFDFGLYLCGATSSQSVRSFTMDLKTGKKVGIGSFVSQDDTTTQLAVARTFNKTKNSCISFRDGVEIKKGGKGSIPRAAAWNVSAKGIHLHYKQGLLGANACSTPTVLLPWTEVAKATQMKGKIHSRVYVAGVKWNKEYAFYEGAALYVSTQGRRVTAFEGPLGVGDGGCAWGVRSGKKAILTPGPWVGNKVALKYASTAANSKITPSSIGKGWRVASAMDLKIIKSNLGTVPTAREICGS